MYSEVMVSDQLDDNGSSDAEKKALSPPSDAQTAMMQELTPLSVQDTSASTAREVSIKQVAPLVLVLTGATFLNVNYSPPSQTPLLTGSDHLGSIRSHHSPSYKQRPQHP
jgi:hypothetical protein